MYAVSNLWAEKHAEDLAPETFIELSVYIPQFKQTLVYTKGDLMQFSHEQTGSLVSGELPKNSIEFSLDNSDGKWNPSNPQGLTRYLTERLKITLRYGSDINGSVEWIPGGVFYLTEWHTPNNGLEASFVARDILEFMMDTTYTGVVSGTLYALAERAVAEADLPDGASVSLCEELKNYSIGAAIEYTTGSESVAEVLQRCANAAGCVMYQNRDGVLVIERVNSVRTGYEIPSFLSYSYPEFEYSRPLKQVRVEYVGSASTVFLYSPSGETQTLTNEFISTAAQAAEIGEWVCKNIRTRKRVSGEFRGDPILDIFDIVKVESKYGTLYNVALTDIKYTFNGSFRASYSGHVQDEGVRVKLYSGEVYSGEVI